MKFVNSREVDTKLWDNLVSKHRGDICFFSYYLDACAKNWGIFVDPDYKKGFAICFQKIGKTMSIYPHPYSKTLAFFNMKQEEILDAIHLLRQDFASGYLQINQDEASTDSWTYQKLEQLQLNTLAKRMLKKGEKFGIICQKSNHEEIAPFVLEILGKKVDEETGARLLLLSDKLQAKNQLISFGIFVENTLLGGMLFAKNESQIYYLLGACKEEARKNGGMYLAMNQALNEATKEQKTVHFGGSNISGIRSFYKAFGGIDHYYRVETWDKGPLWLKSLKRLKKMLK